MRKKVFSFFLICIVLFTHNVSAKDTAYSSIVMDLDSGRVLYQKKANEKRLIASITKIMTAIVTLENSNIEDTVEIGDEVLKMYGTNIYIEVGEKIKIKDLLYGLLLRSGNDAAVALAVAVSKSEDEFVKKMNEKAQEIGMKNTVFANPHGLDEESQNYSTAYDMALLSKYAYQNRIYRKIVKTKKYTVSTGEKTYLWYNRNKLLSSYENCTGGKNGYTPSAGKTLVTTATKNGLNLTIVTLNDANIYQNHKSLYENIFSKYQNYTIIDKDSFAIDKVFYDGVAYLKKSFTYPLTVQEVNQIKTTVMISNQKLKNQEIGNINIYLKDKKIGSLDIYNQENRLGQKKEKTHFLSKLINFFSKK